MTTTEPELFEAYRISASEWSAPCDCGLPVRSPTPRVADIEKAIARHNNTEIHRRWRSWQTELAQVPRDEISAVRIRQVRPESSPTSRDLSAPSRRQTTYIGLWCRRGRRRLATNAM